MDNVNNAVTAISKTTAEGMKAVNALSDRAVFGSEIQGLEHAAAFLGVAGALLSGALAIFGGPSYE